MMWSIVAYSVGTGLSGTASGVIMLTLSRFIVGMGWRGVCLRFYLCRGKLAKAFKI